jgi:inosine-uridine nucleoside N-ribohydrolase
LTNVALACALDPSFAPNIRDLTIIGGNFDPKSKTPNGRNFNTFFDPEAMQLVFNAPWKKLTNIPSDAMGFKVTPEMERAVAAAATPLAKHLSRFPNPDKDYTMWDEIGAMLWIDPSLATQSMDRYLEVDLDRGASYGNLIAWTPDNHPGLGEPLVHLILGMDEDKFRHLFVQWITSPTPRSRK